MRVKCEDCQLETTVSIDLGGATTCPNCGCDLQPAIDRLSGTGSLATQSLDTALLKTSDLDSAPVDDAPVDDTALGPAKVAADSEMPDRIGRYRLLKMVGAGACGVVYKAHDEQLDSHVAIKVPRRTKGKQRLRRILPEARALAKLRHPNIVRVISAEAYGEDGYCVVMDWIEGHTLRTVMANQQLSAPERVALMIKIADAVHAAHKTGFVHRDLKPANILIDEHGTPFVSDFGLALEESNQHKHRDEFAGTVAYMSPEQIRGESHYLDGRSDVWALGVILYELLANRRPFGGDSGQMADEICHRAPKPISLFDEKVPPELEAIVKNCMAKAVDQRIATAGQLRDALKSVSEQTLATPRSQRSWSARVAVAVALLALCAGVVTLARGRIFPRTETDSGTGADSNPLLAPPTLRTLEIGRWNKLLDRPLERLIWPGAGSGSRLLEEPDLESATAIINGNTMLKACEIKHKNCSVVLTINQADWTGQLGIFYGMVFRNGQYHYEQIQFAYIPARFEDASYRLDRSVVSCDANLQHQHFRALATSPIPSPGQKKHELTLVFKDGVLDSVLWDAARLPDLVELPRPNIGISDNRGSLGVFLQEGTAEFSLFRVFVEREL